MVFRPNAKLGVDVAKETGVHSSSNRPDAIVSRVAGTNLGENFVFGEVKPAHVVSDTYLLLKDLLRLGVFAKDAIDQDKLEAVITFQAVGKYLSRRGYLLRN